LTGASVGISFTAPYPERPAPRSGGLCITSHRHLTTWRSRGIAMTTDELEQLLAQQPVALLHRLARGRVHRHLRAGKRRLIELLTQHSSHNRAGFESDLQTLIGERHARSASGTSQAPSLPAITHKKVLSRGTEPESAETAVTLSAW